MTPRAFVSTLLLAAACAPARAADLKAPVAEAERVAAAAAAQCAARSGDGLPHARRALELTAEFEPLAFVSAGRKGEVVEDAYLAARASYREHRARLYGAIGACLASAGKNAEAGRYLRRAFDLDPHPPQALALARVWVAEGRGREALDLILSVPEGWSPEALVVAAAAADAAGLPSLQAEIDRARLRAMEAARRPELRDGPFRLPDRTRLSTGVPADLEQDGLTILYNADDSCRSCSADMQAVRRSAPRDARILVSAPGPEQDRSLRQVMQVYRYDWTVVVGGGADKSLGLQAPSILLIARKGLLGVVLKPPFANLPEVVERLAKPDVQEVLPRPAWNRRPPDRRAAAGPLELLPEGLAPGEDTLAPQAFADALAAYRAGRFRDALRLFDEVAKRGDGFLLPPEARLNRALCLLGLGQREAARVLLLKVGDSRFQEEVDRALERSGSPSKGASSNLAIPGRTS